MVEITPDFIREQAKETILNELESRLEEKQLPGHVKHKMLDQIEDTVEELLNRFSDRDLEPDEPIESEEDFRLHLTSIVQEMAPELEERLAAIEEEIQSEDIA